MKTPARIALLLLLLSMALGGIFLLYTYDPARVPYMPRCLFHWGTGLYCPGCGSTRAVHQLLHGHFLSALHSNAMIVLAWPALLCWGVTILCARQRPDQPMPRWLPWFLLSAIMVFGVIRNIPVAPFLALIPR